MEIEDKICRQIEILNEFSDELDEDLMSNVEKEYESFLVTMPYTVGQGNMTVYDLYCRVGLRDTISECYNFLRAILSEREQIKRLDIISAYQSQIDSMAPVVSRDIDICSYCNVRTVIDMEASEMECPSCGRVMTLRGIIFKDEQILPTEGGHRVKANSYKTSKHFATWMNRILAVEKPANGDALIIELRAYIKCHKIARDLVTYKTIREYLKQAKKTDANDNIAWLLKEITGRAPPELTFEERSDIEYRFNTIIDTFDNIREQSLTKPIGRKYYPFFIYRIIKCKFARIPGKLRLLEYIHEQQDKTIKKNDDLYDQILDKANNPRLTAVD